MFGMDLCSQCTHRSSHNSKLISMDFIVTLADVNLRFFMDFKKNIGYYISVAFMVGILLVVE